MSRSVDEWIAKHDDQAIPGKVRARVFQKHGGICALSGRKIRAGDAWDLDHIKALWRGGEHREANLQPVLREKHREKSAEEQTEKAKADRIMKKHLGIFPKSKTPLRSRGFAKRNEAHDQ